MFLVDIVMNCLVVYIISIAFVYIFSELWQLFQLKFMAASQSQHTELLGVNKSVFLLRIKYLLVIFPHTVQTGEPAELDYILYISYATFQTT